MSRQNCGRIIVRIAGIVRMRRNGIRRNGIRRNGIRRDGLRRDGIGRDGIRLTTNRIAPRPLANAQATNPDPF